MARDPGTLESGVLFGTDGQLFLADGEHSVLDFVSRQRSISSESVSRFAANIESRRRACDAQGIPYLHVLFPDKQSVLTANFPISDPVCLGEAYLQRASAVSDMVLYPRSFLQRSGPDVFQKTDTHLSDRGTVIVAKAVMDRLFDSRHEEAITAFLADIRHSMEWVGDLGRRFDPPIGEVRKVYRGDHRTKWFHNGIVGGNNGLVDIRFNAHPVYDKRLLMFGDYFGRELCRFLSLLVREIVFLRTPFFHQEMFEQIQPDVVISENVERYLSNCTPDADRPAFMMYPYLGQAQYMPDREFSEAFSAVLSYPRRPYQALRGRVFPGAAPVMPDTRLVGIGAD